jgi:hypothetical protein
VLRSGPIGVCAERLSPEEHERRLSDLSPVVEMAF